MNDIHDPVGQPHIEISLVSIGRFFGRNILIIGTCVLVCAVATGFLAFKITPKYKSEVVFSSASGGSGGDLGQLGGLAAIAGINIGGAGKRSEESLEFLRSRGFTARFIQKHNLMPVLFAKQWDAQKGKWRDDQEPPTLSDGVKRFSFKIMQIAEDRRTGIVTLAIIWRDRNAAAEWANQLIDDADSELRQRAIAELQRSIEYLKQEVSQATLFELQTAVYKVMESSLKDEMLARTRDAYAFKVLDPAVARDPKDIDSPNKPLFVVLGALFGLMVGSMLAGLRRGPAKHRAH